MAESALQDVFVGREDILFRLRELAQRAHQGQPTIVLIRGTAGIGKSALLSHFGADCERAFDDALVLRAGLGYPFGADLTALARHLTQQADAFAQQRRLEFDTGAFMTELVPGLMGQVPLFGPFLEAAVKSLPQLRAELYQRGAALQPDRLSPADVPEGSLGLFRRWLTWLAQKRFVVLLMDDAHEAWASLLPLLWHMADTALQCRVLPCIAFRAEAALPNAEAHRHFQKALAGISSGELGAATVSIELGPLSRHEFDLYLDKAFVRHNFDPAPLKELYTASRGNPLFIQSVLESWKRGGLIAQRRGQWVFEAAPSGLTVPQELSTVVDERLARVTPEERWLLRCASVQGISFDRELALGLASTDAGHMLRTRQVLDDLVQAGFLESNAGSMSFAHPSFQMRVYQLLSPDIRRDLHRKTAQMLEARRNDEDALRIANHYLQAGVPPKAWRHALTAGQQAIFRQEYALAANLCRRALDIEEAAQGRTAERARLRYLLMYAGAYVPDELRGLDIHRLMEEGAAWAKHARSPQLAVMCRYAYAVALNASGNYARSCHEAEATLALAQGMRATNTRKEWMLKALHLKGIDLLAMNSFRLREQPGTGIVIETPDMTALMRQRYLGQAARDAARCFQQALALDQELDRPTGLVRDLLALAQLSHPIDAAPLYEKALTLAKQNGDGLGQAASLLGLGLTILNLEQDGLDEGIHLLEQALQTADQAGNNSLRWACLYHLIFSYREAGRDQQAFEVRQGLIKDLERHLRYQLPPQQIERLLQGESIALPGSLQPSEWQALLALTEQVMNSLTYAFVYC